MSKNTVISIKIMTDKEESKTLISSFVFPGIPFTDNGKYITFVVNDKCPRYLEVLSKIPELLALDNLVEISNSKENNQCLLLPSIDSFLKECSDEVKQSVTKETKKRYFEYQSSDKLEEGEIKKSKFIRINYSRKDRYLKDRKIFIDNYLSEVDRLIRTNPIRIGGKYNLFSSLQNKGIFNKDFYLFYSRSFLSKEFLGKLGINETPMDIIAEIINAQYNGQYQSMSNISQNGFVTAEVQRIK